MLCVPSNHRQPIFILHENGGLQVLLRFVIKKSVINSEKSLMNMASSNSQNNEPQHGWAKRTELPEVNINMERQSTNTERASLIRSSLYNWVQCPISHTHRERPFHK